MGAKASKLGSWDKHPAYCQDSNANEWHMRNDRKCDVDFKPGEQMRMMYYSVMPQTRLYTSIHIHVHLLQN